MINTDVKKQWIETISEMLGTPVSEVYFDLMTSKQRFAVYTSLSIGDGVLAKSIMEQTKAKLKPIQHSDKTNFYLKAKKII